MGQDGGYRRGKGQIAEGEAAGTVTVPEWNGDMFLWPEFAAKFNAFRTAVQAQWGGDQGPDFWVRTLSTDGRGKRNPTA